MANTSLSSSMISFTEIYSEEQREALLASIRMNLQDIRKATHDVTEKFKVIREEMYVTDALINAIQANTLAKSLDDN